MPQQGLGGHENQGLAEGQGNLAAQDVEKVGWGGAVGHLKYQPKSYLSGCFAYKLDG